MKTKSIYLVANYLMRPRRRVSTQIKGWQANTENIAYDEQVAVCRALKKNDITMAKVILDLSSKTVIRNGWNNDKTFDELFAYFHAGYPQYTTTVMSELDPEYLLSLNTVLPSAETIAALPNESAV